MILRIFTVFTVYLSFSLTAMAANDTSMMNSVMKIKAYTRNSIDGSYTFSHYGSAVLIDGKRILTNAHVILDADEKSPTGYYEICRTEKGKKLPTCFTTGQLKSYDTIADLAVLELTNPLTDVKGVIFADTKELPIATNVIVYGYPSIGGLSITRTEGKIGGIDDSSYKFDGTIDRGNSGGGAFNTDGKLVGIPYAVKSENGMIGYIIPISRIGDFLAGKTDNIEKFTEKVNSAFSSYIKNIELLYKNPDNIQGKYVEIKNANKNGFTLFSASSSITGDIFMYYFLDKSSRVVMTVGCTEDASTTWKSSTDFLQDYQKSLDTIVDRKTTSTGFYLDSAKNIYNLKTTSIKETKGERSSVSNFVYKTTPMCSVAIVAQDGNNKDKASYGKAVSLAQSIKFTKTSIPSDTFQSPFFSVKSIPKNVYIDQSFYLGSISPHIAFMLSNHSIIFSRPSILEFDDLDGYMNYEYSDEHQYTGKTYTFEDFFARYITTGYNNISDERITTKDGKKLVMTIRNYSDSSSSTSKYEKLITFFYPFLTPEGEYRAYKIDFTVTSGDDADIQQIRQLMESIEFPGTSPFKN